MIIDLHIHSKSSDGALPVNEIIKEAKTRHIELMSVTDHDSIESQEIATDLADKAGISYVSGVELNVTFSHPSYGEGRQTALDFLGYQFDVTNRALRAKLEQIAVFRKERAGKILDRLNVEFEKQGIDQLSENDFRDIQTTVNGTLGRRHIANYLVQKAIVNSVQEAFDLYLVKCNVPKFPLFIEDASNLVRDAGGKLVLAHPNDLQGTSLVAFTRSLTEQTHIIEDSMEAYIDGVECWHSRNDKQTTEHYLKFARKHELIMTGGSDCHQKPILMGTVGVPEYVANQFKH